MKQIQQTSILSYQDLDISLCSKLKQAILLILKTFPNGLTDSEIINYLSKNAINLEPRVRRYELMKEGIIYSIGKRKCSITGKKALVWILK